MPLPAGRVVDDIPARLADLARASLGLVTHDQLVEAGLTRQRRRTAVANGVLVPVVPRVFRHRAWPPSWPQAVLGAVLAAGPGAVASHMSAAALWGIEGVDRGAVEVTVPRGRQPRAVGGRAHRSRDLSPVDVDRRRAIPVTTAARTLLDIAPRLDAQALERAVDGAARDGLVWLPHLQWRLDELRVRGRPGVARLAAVLDGARPVARVDSWLEGAALRLVERAGLPRPRAQLSWRPGGGGRVRLDMAWPEHRLAAEFDGHATHATRRQRQADAERAARLLADGWRVVRFTYEDVVERPAYVVATLRGLLGMAA